MIHTRTELLDANLWADTRPPEQPLAPMVENSFVRGWTHSSAVVADSADNLIRFSPLPQDFFAVVVMTVLVFVTQTVAALDAPCAVDTRNSESPLQTTKVRPSAHAKTAGRDGRRKNRRNGATPIP